MPFTGAANAALDKVTVQFEEVAGLVSAYAETDLFCYRAEAPRELLERQQRAWNPMLNWSRDALNAPLNIAHGVMFIRQPQQSINALRSCVNKFNPFELTALYDLVGLSGSLVAGLAVVEGHEAPESVWDICQVDDAWQKEQWGQDEIAEELTQGKRAKFLQVFKFFTTLK
jgi:chaperone required for assembly of F1-ATPase